MQADNNSSLTLRAPLQCCHSSLLLTACFSFRISAAANKFHIEFASSALTTKSEHAFHPQNFKCMEIGVNDSTRTRTANAVADSNSCPDQWRPIRCQWCAESPVRGRTAAPRLGFRLGPSRSESGWDVTPSWIVRRVPAGPVASPSRSGPGPVGRTHALISLRLAMPYLHSGSELELECDSEPAAAALRLSFKPRLKSRLRLRRLQLAS
jgi:hypothetical protein